MAAYVIKSWKAQSGLLEGTLDYIHIEGRAGGFISWLLSLLKISPTVALTVTADKITFEEGSLQGSVKFLTPLENTCSTFFGYTKPWKEAVILGVIIGFPTFFILGIPGIIAGGLYYFLNKTLTIGFTDVGGHRYAINFKRSVIEGQNLDEATAEKVCAIIQERVDAKRQRG